MKPFIIAEIGSNWRKSDDNFKNWNALRKQVTLAKASGADAVKFQLFTAQELYGPEVIGTTFARDFDRFSLSKLWFPRIEELCQDCDIEFMCSAFSVEGFRFVDPYVKHHKLASPEAQDPELIKWLMSQSKQVIYSDGTSADGDRLHELGLGRPEDIRMACVSNYPAKLSDYDLSFSGLGKLWGLSDHTLGSDLALVARARGAVCFEKHVDFLYGDGIETPDTCVSVDGTTFGEYCNDIRSFEPSRCDKIKQSSEKLYGRRETANGWFRPIPPSADLAICPVKK